MDRGNGFKNTLSLFSSVPRMNNIIICCKTFVNVTSGTKYSCTYSTHTGMCMQDKWTVMRMLHFGCFHVCSTANEIVYLLRPVKSLQQWEIRPLRRVRVTWQILIQLVCLVWMHSNKKKNLYFHTDHLDLYGTVFPEVRENDFFPQQFAISSSPGPYIEICPIGLTKVNPRLISELKPGIHSYNIWLKKNVIIEARWEKKITESPSAYFY